jgi:hypothetical protein
VDSKDQERVGLDVGLWMFGRNFNEDDFVLSEGCCQPQMKNGKERKGAKSAREKWSQQDYN